MALLPLRAFNIDTSSALVFSGNSSPVRLMKYLHKKRKDENGMGRNVSGSLEIQQDTKQTVSPPVSISPQVAHADELGLYETERAPARVQQRRRHDDVIKAGSDAPQRRL